MASDVRIRFTAVDETGPVFEGVIEGLEGIGDRGRNTATGLDLVESSLGKISGLAGRSLGIFAQLETAQISLEVSALRLQSAEEAAAHAMEEHGAGSVEAIKALRARDQAEAALEKTTLRANTAVGLAALSSIQFAIEGMRAAHAAVELGRGMQFAAAGSAVLQTVLAGPLAPIVAGAIAAGILGVSVAFQEMGSSADRAGPSLDSLEVRLARVAAQVDALKARAGVAADATERLERRRAIDLVIDQGDPSRLAALRQHMQDQLAGLKLDLPLRLDLDGFRAAAAGIRQEIADIDRQIREARVTDLTELEPALESRKAELLRTLSDIELHINTTITGDEEARLASAQLRQEIEGDLARIDAKVEETSKKTARDLEVAAQSAAKAWHEAQLEMTNAVETLGVELARLSPAMLRSLGLEALAQAKERERDLQRQALQTTPALLDQLEVTARKGETTQELMESLGLTVEQERQLAAQGRITTEGIISQEGAARRAKAALDDLRGAEGGGEVMGAGRIEREQMVRLVTGHGSFDIFASQLPERMKDPAFARSVGVPAPLSDGEMWDRTAGANEAARLGYTRSGAGWVPMMATGGFVRETGLAVVHKGETVVPAQVEHGGGFAGGLRVDKIEVHIHGNANRDDVREGVLDGLRMSYDQHRLHARRAP